MNDSGKEFPQFTQIQVEQDNDFNRSTIESEEEPKTPILGKRPFQQMCQEETQILPVKRVKLAPLGMNEIPYQDLHITAESIGRGGSAEVSEALYKSVRVALKQLKYPTIQKDAIIIREAETLISLRSQYVVLLIGISRHPETDQFLLILEYMEEGSLHDLLFEDKTQLENSTILQIALDIAHGLQYLHSQTPMIIHRDLKSHNVLLYQNKTRAKIADFGTAFSARPGAQPKTVIGSIGIAIPPEMLAEMPYDEKVDVFSFGVLLFEMCTNERLSQLEEGYRLTRIENKISNEQLRQIVSSCCKSTPAERPSINRVIEQLQDIVENDRKKAMTWAMNALSMVGSAIAHLVEISDEPMNIGHFESITNLDMLPVDRREVLEEKWIELKKFDNKLTKTLEDCYDKDKLLQQLFTFKQEKNIKIAVRVFISSASAGLATNVAKLMRPFNGKSIVDGVHSGLQIGNTIVEWNQSGIVHIGELKHANAVAVLFDVQDSVKFDFTDEVAQKMVSFIQKWNTEHRYSSDEFNSHRFVRDFLQYTMNIPLIDQFQGPLGSYMDNVMMTGDATPRLFSKSNGVMVFKTHEELEETERAIKSKLSEDELKLMKIFHRGFQLQEAANGKDVSSCSYGLPTNGLEILNDGGKPMKF